jgi:hypothetical protein
MSDRILGAVCVVAGRRHGLGGTRLRRRHLVRTGGADGPFRCCWRACWPPSGCLAGGAAGTAANALDMPLKVKCRLRLRRPPCVHLRAAVRDPRLHRGHHRDGRARGHGLPAAVGSSRWPVGAGLGWCCTCCSTNCWTSCCPRRAVHPAGRPLMETLQHLLVGFGVALTPTNLGVAAIGAFIGTMVGMLPGLGPINGVAILMPLAFALKLPPETALILLAAVYMGCEYGGRISSILLNVPGDAGAIMTALDGYPMAQERAWPAWRCRSRPGVPSSARWSPLSASCCLHPAGALGAGLRAGRVLCADVLCLCLHHRADGRRAHEGAAGSHDWPVAVHRRAGLQLRRLPFHRRQRAPVRRHPVHRGGDWCVLDQRDFADAGDAPQQRRHAQTDRTVVVQPQGNDA